MVIRNEPLFLSAVHMALQELTSDAAHATYLPSVATVVHITFQTPTFDAAHATQSSRVPLPQEPRQKQVVCAVV